MNDPGYKILLADDTALNRTMTGKLLERRGHSVVTAANGKEALERAREESFDVILMDLHMPVMDGLESAQAIRDHEKAETRRHTPIIALTADEDITRKDGLKSAGMDGFVMKPIEIEALLSAIRKVLQSAENA